MKKLLTLVTCFTMMLNACKEKNSVKTHLLNYPETVKKPVVENYFETEVIDNYRWLEDDRSKETEAWVAAENEVTFDYLSNIPYRKQLKDRLSELWNYEKIGAPFTEGDYTYYYKNNGLQNQYVVYRKKDDTNEEVFLDPNTFSEDATTSLSGLTFSKDGKTAAYSISEGGSDWRKIIVIDVESKKVKEDTLVDVKFSGISWRGNEGFYYSSYDKPDGSELSAKTDQHKLYYHKLGTSQKNDQVIFGASDAQKHRYVGGSLTEDDRYLIISASTSTSGNKLFIQDLTKKSSALIPVVNNFDSDTYVIDNRGTTLYLVTNLNAPNQKIVTVDATDPAPKNWKDFIPETAHVLSASSGGGYFFTEYMVDAVSKVLQYDFDGNKIREIALPGVGNAGGFGGKKDAVIDYFSFTNYNTPSSIYTLNIKTGETKLYWSPDIDFNPNDYESSQVFYPSKDGTKIPMIITHKKGIKLSGKNPTILYGYGGFNISLNPGFSITNAIWMEQGGIYAVPNLRGGGEYGKED